MLLESTQTSSTFSFSASFSFLHPSYFFLPYVQQHILNRRHWSGILNSSHHPPLLYFTLSFPLSTHTLRRLAWQARKEFHLSNGVEFQEFQESHALPDAPYRVFPFLPRYPQSRKQHLFNAITTCRFFFYPPISFHLPSVCKD